MRVGRNELLRAFCPRRCQRFGSFWNGTTGLPGRHNSGQEINHLDGIITLRVEKIQSVLLLVDIVCVPGDESAGASMLGSSVTHLCALCLRINCSSHKNVRLCVTFCLTCTLAFHVFLAASLVHAGH